MSDDKQVNQPQNDVQVAEVKETKTDETKPSTTFNQEDVDRIVKQRLEAEKSKHQRQIDEVKKQYQEIELEIQKLISLDSDYIKEFLAKNNEGKNGYLS